MSVPSTVAMIVETTAIPRLVTIAVCSPGRPNGFCQAASENSPHTKLKRPGGSLNEKAIITRIGSAR